MLITGISKQRNMNPMIAVAAALNYGILLSGSKLSVWSILIGCEANVNLREVNELVMPGTINNYRDIYKK